jgi:uncharacterized protein
VTAGFHGTQVVEHGRQRHPQAAPHVRRRQGSLFEEQAIDGILVGAQGDASQGGGDQPTDALIEHKEIEQQGDLPARLLHRSQYYHETVAFTTDSWYVRAMRRVLLALATMAAVSSCTAAASWTGPRPSASPPSVTPDLGRYVGAYRTSDDGIWVLNASGHLLSLRDSTFRRLYPTATVDRFTVGPAFAIPAPTQANVSFHLNGAQADAMTITPIHGQAVAARRLPFTETEVRIPAQGATLAGTITEPLTAGPHPGIVIVHGSEPGERFYYGVWVGLYASLGLTVLAYDKRGHGESTGTYPGEYASGRALDVYASDASVALRFLAAWPGVDARRVGFHGGSQGGWTVPLAIDRYQAPAAFAMLFSAPAVTVDQQDVWAGFSNGSRTMPSASSSAMDAAVRAAPTTGYDPRPVLARVIQPILWVNGGVDRQVPTTVNTEVLRSYHRPNWDIEVLPGVDHGLFENPSGLEPDEAKATMLARGIWDVIATWLARTAGSLPLP